MKTPAQMIAALDGALAKAGTPVVLRRFPDKANNPNTKIDVATLASTRPISADELVGDIDQTMRVAVISPTDLIAAGWPVPIVKGDKLVIGGREINIELPKPVEVLGVVVRYDLVIRG